MAELAAIHCDCFADAHLAVVVRLFVVYFRLLFAVHSADDLLQNTARTLPSRVAKLFLSQKGALSCYSRSVNSQGPGAPRMEWTTPQHEEIDLNCEVSSYANAEL